MSRPHVIVLGNEKGGSGKSTTAMHLIVALLKSGQRVGTVDLDSRQKSLTRYLENRLHRSEVTGKDLGMPQHHVVGRSDLDSIHAGQKEEEAWFNAAMAELGESCDYIVIDSPGSDSFLSRLGHSRADTLITPMNDSFVDFDLIGRIDPDSYEVLKPSLYSEMVWDCRKRRAITDRGSIDWVVMRNRLSSLDAKNKRRVADALEILSKRIGFRLAPGFGERVIFRELFPKGLTLLDLVDDGGEALTMSHVAARQEVRDLLRVLDLLPAAAQKAAHSGRPENITHSAA